MLRPLKSKHSFPKYFVMHYFALQKGKMWRFTSSGRLLSAASGEYVQNNYRGLANGFKAVYQQQSDDKVIFLKGM